jgi:hypothetical protein
MESVNGERVTANVVPSWPILVTLMTENDANPEIDFVLRDGNIRAL